MSHERCKRSLLLHLLILLALLSPLHTKELTGIIPKPEKFVAKHGYFILTQNTHYYSQTPLADNAIHYLQSHLQKSSGYTLRRISSSSQIHFLLNREKIKSEEAYHLDITPEKITITAKESAGFFYAAVSLLQLMHPDIWQKKYSAHREWHIPACHIEDAPRFHWRGMMLDVSRNFFSVAYVKTFIDRMAQYKLNRFHWHLTDDEGWRIEIKRYPKLTEIGATRGPGTKLPFSMFPAMRGAKTHRESGHYTQQQIRQIVKYAKERNIEIIPEIDLPGHAKAAVTAYPDLLLDPHDSSRFHSVQKIVNNTINPAHNNTYIFLDNVLKEVSSLFPFDYIHIGGDEVPKGAWRGSPEVAQLMKAQRLKNYKDVENYFFNRIDHILSKYGKKMAGWQEITEGDPSIRKNSLIMAWKSTKDGLSAIGKGYSVVMTPVKYLYFDQQYVRNRAEPGHTWSTPVSTYKVYSFHPPTSAKGVQACLWSETLLNEKIADYLTWPRALALSEVAWSKKTYWNDFKKRMKKSALPRLKIQGIHYRR